MNPSLEYLGIALILTGTIILALSTLPQTSPSSQNSINGSNTESKTKIFIGGFIGPIPFGFSNSKTLLYIGISILALTLLAFYILRSNLL